MRPDQVSGKVSLVTSLEKVDRGKTETPVTAYKYKKARDREIKAKFPNISGRSQHIGSILPSLTLIFISLI